MGISVIVHLSRRVLYVDNTDDDDADDDDDNEIQLLTTVKC